jgi:hypothetical protein
MQLSGMSRYRVRSIYPAPHHSSLFERSCMIFAIWSCKTWRWLNARRRLSESKFPILLGSVKEMNLPSPTLIAKSVVSVVSLLSLPRRFFVIVATKEPSSAASIGDPFSELDIKRRKKQVESELLPLLVASRNTCRGTLHASSPVTYYKTSPRRSVREGVWRFRLLRRTAADGVSTSIRSRFFVAAASGP